MKKVLALYCLTVAVTLGAVELMDYKTIVCFGDSLTHHGTYHKWLQLELSASNPDTPRRILNRGIGGYRVGSLIKRAPEMLAEDKPELVLILVGINDLMYTTDFEEESLPLDEAMKKYPIFAQYARQLEQLVDFFLKNKVNVVLLTPTPYNEFESPTIKETVRKNMDSTGVKNLAEILRKVGKEKNVEVIDIATPLREKLAVIPELIPDRVHPNQEAHRIMAETILGRKLRRDYPKEKIAERLRTAEEEMQKSYLAHQNYLKSRDNAEKDFRDLYAK